MNKTAGSTAAKGAYLFATVVSAVYMIVLVVTLGVYGLTWDAPENLLTGRHYWRFFTSGDSRWLDFAYYDELYQQAGEDRPPNYNRHFNAPERYPPLANVIANATHELVTEQAGLAPDYVGYNLGVVLFAGLAVFVLACFSWQALGPVAAVAATLALVTYPLFFEHAHNNLKDVPLAALVLLSLWAYWQGERLDRRAWWLLSAVAAGAALATRLIAAEIWLIIGLAYLPQVWGRRGAGIRQALRVYAPLVWHVPLAVLVFFLLWPWLWPDPAARLMQHMAFAQDVSRGLHVLYDGQIRSAGETLPWHYTVRILVLTTPLIVLAGGGVGAVVAALRGLRLRDAAGLMFLLLFAGALVRSSLPGIPQYDGTRHMMEGIIAFAGLFGLGAATIWGALSSRVTRLRPSIGAAILVLLFLPVMSMLVRLHPYQGIYYNALIGGPQGATGRFPQEYWGSSFALGTAWLNEHVEADALILPRVGGHLVADYLRDDLTAIPDEALAGLPPDTPLYVIYMVRPDKYDGLVEYVDEHIEPIFTLERDGVAVLKVVRTNAASLQQIP